MSEVAIRVEGLGKQYRIGRSERYRTLRDTLTGSVSAPFRQLGSLFRHSGLRDAAVPGDRFWALRDVSFEVPRGAVVGVIGRNGAGKSTLLKILSRITEPTEGRVEMHGRVGSLLEVGTGFHPELTGRENIFLNGAILGMRRAEIRRKFDEIVAFAEVEPFIDTPVKHFSSGMYMRLAFAVAASLEAEILLVDEVLAVGDVEFQRKCLGKMSEVAMHGRTVLLVSHSMAAVTSLCRSGLLLCRGEIACQGGAAAVVDAYLQSLGNSNHEWIREPGHPELEASCLQVRHVRVGDGRDAVRTRFKAGEDITVHIACDATRMPSTLLCALMVRTSSGVPVFHLTRSVCTETLSAAESLELTCRILACPLYPGEYVLSVWIGRNAHQELDSVKDALSFVMEQGEVPGVDFDLSWRHGVCHCDSEWAVQPLLCSVA